MNQPKELQYNTQQGQLPLPEYGRSVQNMVNHALTIQDRAERQRCANTIIRIMGGMFPHLRNVADFSHKLWDHLAIMSGFQLDIDYPVEVITPADLLVRPERVSYPQTRIRYRHYGKYIQELIDRACQMEDGAERRQLLDLIINYMKKDYNTWNKEGVENQKILDDVYELSDGRLALTLADVHFYEARTNNNYFKPKNGKNKKNNYHKYKK